MATYEVGSGKTYSTIQLAVNAIPATLTEQIIIKVYAGTYDESVLLTGKTTTVSNNIIFEQVSGESVTWKYTGGATTDNRCLDIDVNNVIVRNFDNFEKTDTARANLIEARSGSDNIVVDRCRFNYTAEDDGYAVKFNGSNSDLTNCITYNCDQAISIQSSGNIFNNTFHFTKQIGIFTNSSAVIRNNIIYATNNSNQLMIYELGGNTTFSNNIYYSPNTISERWFFNGVSYSVFGDWVTNSGDVNSYNADPELTDIANGDFTIVSSASLAADSGFNTALTEDFTGASRPVNTDYDIGAYEFGSQEEPGNGDTPLLCWQLTGKYSNGRTFSLNGPNKFPGLDSLKIPEGVKFISVIEDGKHIL